MAAMILLIGLRFLFNVRWLDPLEKAGSVIWKRIQPLVMRISGKPGVASKLLLGLCWGLIPCGLVYSVLLMAASSASAPEGGVIMLAFGAGTIPSMLGVAWMSPALTVFMRDQWVRRVIGFSLVLLALWTIIMVSGTRMH
jgi:sulfite exporter TauE/SafE